MVGLGLFAKEVGHWSTFGTWYNSLLVYTLECVLLPIIKPSTVQLRKHKRKQLSKCLSGKKEKTCFDCGKCHLIGISPSVSAKTEQIRWAHSTNEINRRMNKKEGNIPSDLIAYHPRSPVISDRIVKRSNPSLSSKGRHIHVMITTVHPTKHKFRRKKKAFDFIARG